MIALFVGKHFAYIVRVVGFTSVGYSEARSHKISLFICVHTDAHGSTMRFLKEKNNNNERGKGFVRTRNLDLPQKLL